MKNLVIAAALATAPFIADDPVTDDPGPIDESSPPALLELTIDSHGSNLGGIMYKANGPGPHPTVILLHGFPGNEKNLDVAQSLRRAGFNVIFYHYRGAWGSEGKYGPGDKILQRGRNRIALDLKDPAQRDQALDLIANADALLEGTRPGVMERLGLGPEDCFARNPKLAYGRMTGWGQDGPLSQSAGHLAINIPRPTGQSRGRRKGFRSPKRSRRRS